MESVNAEIEPRHLELGTFRVYPGESPNEELRDFLGNLLSLTSKGHRMSKATAKGIEEDLYFMLKIKKLTGIELCLNGNSNPSYSLNVDYPDSVIKGGQRLSIEDRVKILRTPLMDFDESRMEKNLLEKVAVFRFNFSSLSEDADKLFMSGTRSKANPNVFEYRTDNLAPPEE